jgi:hypothetical protein
VKGLHREDIPQITTILIIEKDLIKIVVKIVLIIVLIINLMKIEKNFGLKEEVKEKTSEPMV